MILTGFSSPYPKLKQTKIPLLLIKSLYVRKLKSCHNNSNKRQMLKQKKLNIKVLALLYKSILRSLCCLRRGNLTSDNGF